MNRLIGYSTSERITPYIFLAPTMLALAVVFLYPIGVTIQTSLYVSSLGDWSGRFVGFRQIYETVRAPLFGTLLATSAIYSAGIVALVWGLGLGTALLIHNNFKLRALARTALIAPWAIPYVAAALIWGYMYDYEFGVLNYLLSRFGIISNKIAFLTACPAALASVTAVSVWKLYPFGMIMFLAALQTIPSEQYEAATIDGADAVQRFWHITLPGVRSVSVFLVLMMAIWTFGRAFAVIFILTGGGPAGCTETIVVRSYLEAFTFHRPGVAASLGVIVLAISLVFASAVLWFTSRRMVDQ